MNDKIHASNPTHAQDKALQPTHARSKLTPAEIIVLTIGASFILLGILVLAASTSQTYHDNPVVYPLLGGLLIFFALGAMMWVPAHRKTKRLRREYYATLV